MIVLFIGQLCHFVKLRNVSQKQILDSKFDVTPITLPIPYKLAVFRTTEQTCLSFNYISSRIENITLPLTQIIFPSIGRLVLCWKNKCYVLWSVLRLCPLKFYTLGWLIDLYLLATIFRQWLDFKMTNIYVWISSGRLNITQEFDVTRNF